jgi:hypothetical protein
MTEERWTVTGPQTLELDAVTALAVYCIDGRVDVVAHDEPVTRVEIHAVDGRPLEVRLTSGGRLTVGHETLMGWKPFADSFRTYTGRARADVHVAVPRGVPVTLGTVKGESLLAGAQARAAAHTVSGSVMVTDVAGPLEVNTVSGEVTVSDHRGDVEVTTVSGEVTVTGWVGAVETNTVSGRVTLDLYDQPRAVRSNAVSGSLLVRVPDAAAVDASLTGINGRLVVDGVQARGFGTKSLRPDGVAATRLEANAVTGDVTVIARGRR